MRHTSLLLFLFVMIAEKSMADEITLNDGTVLQGELLKVSRKGMIVEFISPRDSSFYNKTLPRNEVVKIIDQSGTILYDEKRLKVGNLHLHNYYFQHVRPVHLDTIKFYDGEEIVARVINMTQDHLWYQTSMSYPHPVSIALEDISEINNQTKETYRWQWIGYSGDRLFEYPHVVVEIGYASVNTHLTALRETIGATFAEDAYSALHLGLLVAINPYISAGLLGHFLFHFGTGESDEDDSDAYRLGLVEIRFGWPHKNIKPWIAISGASQSIILFPNSSFKWKSQSWGLGYGAGLEYHITDFVHIFGAVRYIPISEKNITPGTQNKIDLSNTVLSFGMQVIL